MLDGWVDPEFPRIVLSCSTCGDDCVKSAVEHQWVHNDDYILLAGIFAGENQYDHEPTFDLIEAREPSTQAPTRHPAKSEQDPFHKIQFTIKKDGPK